MEWQHSNANFAKLIETGLCGYIRDINRARQNFLGKRDNLAFLAALEMVIRGIGRRVDQYRAFCLNRAMECTDPARKAVLRRMAENCAQVPMNPARSFEQAIQCLYIAFSFLSDSLGPPTSIFYHFIERTLNPVR